MNQKQEETLEQLERRIKRKVEFDEWSREKNRDFLATPFQRKDNCKEVNDHGI